MNATAFRSMAVEDMMVVRVPMSRAIYRRLLAEGILLDRAPAVLARDILVAAFNSGDVSQLREANPLQSVASASLSSRNTEHE